MPRLQHVTVKFFGKASLSLCLRLQSWLPTTKTLGREPSGFADCIDNPDKGPSLRLYNPQDGMHTPPVASRCLEDLCVCVRALTETQQVRYAPADRIASAKSARSRGSYLRVSFKNTRETAQAINGWKLQRAVKYLENVQELKEAVPMRRYAGSTGRSAQGEKHREMHPEVVVVVDAIPIGLRCNDTSDILVCATWTGLVEATTRLHIFSKDFTCGG